MTVAVEHAVELALDGATAARVRELAEALE